jgi:hypothetical protein
LLCVVRGLWSLPLSNRQTSTLHILLPLCSFLCQPN